MKWDLISRCLSGSASDDEMRELDEWKKNATNKEIWDKALLAWQTVGDFKISERYNVEREWLNVRKKINPNKKMKQISISILKYAAVFALAILCSHVFSVLKSNEKTQWFKVYVPKGEQTHLTLSDGTVVKLNSETTFCYPENFSKNNRLVRLDGEGFFEVTSDSENPFYIETTHQNIKVLGTKFNLNAYQKSDSTVTALLHGKVALLNKEGRKVIELSPNEKAVLKNSTGKIWLKKVDKLTDVGWKDGVYYFKSIRLVELMNLLERWYGVIINFSSDSLKEERFTGKFFRDQTVWDALNLLKLTMPIDYLPGKRVIEINDKK